jgi:tetratricopeptide (TPR) repeat protein
MGNYEAALADFDRAIALNEKYTWVIAYRGLTYILLGNYEAAVVDSERIIAIDPHYDWSFYNLGLARLAVGMFDQGMLHLEQAIALAQVDYEKDPQYWRNTFNLALYHLAAGHALQAEQIYSQNLQAPVGFVRAAVSDLDDFLHLFPDHTQAQEMRTLLQTRFFEKSS